MKKALVLYSGGLDSRLVVRMLQDQDFQVTALYFALPFGCCGYNLAQEKIKLITIDVKKEPLLSEYLKILKNPKFGTGAGINPCRDCKIFMFKKAKEYADKHSIEIIATGEVVGQRPMSQSPSAIKIIDKKLDFEVLRPLCAKRLKETSFEKRGLVNQDKLLNISGRGRKVQMALAEKYNIKYPTPGGGCLLCEKEPASRLKHLLNKNLITEETLPLTKIGRHFFINNTWFIVAKNAKESKKISDFSKRSFHASPNKVSLLARNFAQRVQRAPTNNINKFVRVLTQCDFLKRKKSKIISKFPDCIKDDIGKPAIYYNKKSEHQKALELQNAYSTGNNEDKRKQFSRFKL